MKKSLKVSSVFLSASIPDPRRHAEYFATADPLAIRDAVRALATVVIPKIHLVWGGHPAISPLICYVLSSMRASMRQNVTLYQSRWFEGQYPLANSDIETIRYVGRGTDLKDSLEKMRLRMLRDDGHNFKAGIFIGGMEGVEEEFELFRMYNKQALLLPLASTGGAAKFLLNKVANPDPRLKTEYAYMNLFQSLLQSQ